MSYRLTWFLSVGLFTAAAWLPALVRSVPSWMNLPLPAGAESWLQQAEQWVIGPQVRLLLFLAPPLESRWPLSGGLAGPHLAILAAAHGLVGWMCAKVLFYLYDWASLRLVWLVAFWVAFMGCMEGLALLFEHFGVIAGS